MIGVSAPTITTERLTLRQPEAQDFEAFAAMWANPIVTRYIDGQPRPREGSWRTFLALIGHWHLKGFGYFLAFDRESGAFVGTIGLANFEREIGADFDAFPEAGWSFTPEWHGRGIATEALRATLAWAETALGHDHFVCVISPDNVASIRVAEKCGFKKVRELTYHDAPTVIYEHRT